MIHTFGEKKSQLQSWVQFKFQLVLFFFLNYTKDCYISFSKVQLQMQEPFLAYLHKT